MNAIERTSSSVPTDVTLTFGDGKADQVNAALILNNNGLKATFLIPPGAFSTVSPGHTGRMAERLVVTNYAHVDAISVGLTPLSIGTLTTDDYAIYDTVGAPAL